MIKRALTIMLTTAIVFTSSIPFAAASPQDINIEIDGSKTVSADTKPEMLDDRVFVPLRLISENLGVDLQWDGKTNTVSASGKFTHIVGTSYIALASGEKIDIGVNSYIKNGSTMVSARMIAEALGCSVEWNSNASTVYIVTPGAAESPAQADGNAAGTDTSDILSTLEGVDFIFSSGAGAWSTAIKMQENGAFIGYYHDSDMGVTGANYPNGTMYECRFEGRFVVTKKIDDFTYSMRLEEFKTEGVIDEEKIVDGVRIITSDAYGLDDPDEFFLYLPGRSTADLDEEFLGWVQLGGDVSTHLPFYGIYNVGGQQGLFSSDN